MALTYIEKELRKFEANGEIKKLASHFAGGMKTICPILPENVIAWKSSTDATFDRTFIHQRMILKLILTGSLISQVDGIPLPMHSGDAILFFPQQFHSSKNLNEKEPYEFLAITFTERDNNFDPLLPLKNRVLTIDTQDEKNLFAIFAAFHQLDNTSPSEAVCLLVSFLLKQLQAAKSLPEARIEAGDGEDFSAICDYIRKNFTKQISLKNIADRFNKTPHTIRRLFHKHYGDITPGKLIRRLRLQYASELIQRSTDSIANIAEKCGFEDQFTFSRAFKNATGVSPLNYRKNFRKKTE